ncbi:4-hydroxy-4-methyl-2-oxoglutarate aldolase [Rhodococcus sp. 27YEA15]|uniref:RraA family protein n=1 Tax=Rhodococcus sp. 27YEA15 TaxID=3156259 RepID=UPI003C7BFA3B
MNTIKEDLLKLGVPTLYEAAGRRGLASGLKLLVGVPFAGQAHTAEITAGDNLGLHHGLMATNPTGDVYCVASTGKGRYGAIGDLLVEQLRAGGWQAIVLDDGIRDLDSLEAPPAIAARGVCSRGTVKRRTGQVGGNISLGGILVQPGDWIVGDRDGVVVIPDSRVTDVLVAAETRLSKETRIAELARTGMTVLAANLVASDEIAISR